MGLYYKHSWIIKCAQTKPEVPYIAGADPAFRLHTRKMRCQTPQSEQVYSVYTEGQKAGLTPHLGFDPAIGSPCKHGSRCITLHQLLTSKPFEFWVSQFQRFWRICLLFLYCTFKTGISSTQWQMCIYDKAISSFPVLSCGRFGKISQKRDRSVFTVLNNPL